VVQVDTDLEVKFEMCTEVRAGQWMRSAKNSVLYL
jgi:hypothetical protein